MNDKDKKPLAPIVVKRTVQHKFSEQEVAKLNVDFRQAYAELKSKESAAKAAQNTHKALVAEASSRMDTLNALLQAGGDAGQGRGRRVQGQDRRSGRGEQGTSGIIDAMRL